MKYKLKNDKGKEIKIKIDKPIKVIQIESFSEFIEYINKRENEVLFGFIPFFIIIIFIIIIILQYIL